MAWLLVVPGSKVRFRNFGDEASILGNHFMRNVAVAIIGAGHASLTALKEVKKVTDNWVLINGGELGTTCAGVGCMPSKAMIELSNRNNYRGDKDAKTTEIMEKPATFETCLSIGCS